MDVINRLLLLCVFLPHSDIVDPSQKRSPDTTLDCENLKNMKAV